MFSAIRSSRAAARVRLFENHCIVHSVILFQAFSTSAARADVAKLTLIGRLGRDPEVKETKNNNQYVTCVLCCTSLSIQC